MLTDEHGLALNETAPAASKRRGVFVRAMVRTYRISRALLALGMLLHIILIITPIAERLSMALDVAQEPVAADVLLCLGGDDSRIVRTAWLYHRGLAPRVVVTNEPEAAESMRDTLVMAGVPKNRILVDNTSDVTADHPGGVARLRGIDPKTQQFLIVTVRQHSRRAAACFRRAGFQHFTIYSGPPPRFDCGAWELMRWRVQVLPSLLYEYSALLKYWLGGRI